MIVEGGTGDCVRRYCKNWWVQISRLVGADWSRLGELFKSVYKWREHLTRETKTNQAAKRNKRREHGRADIPTASPSSPRTCWGSLILPTGRSSALGWPTCKYEVLEGSIGLKQYFWKQKNEERFLETDVGVHICFLQATRLQAPAARARAQGCPGPSPRPGPGPVPGLVRQPWARGRCRRPGLM